MTKLQTKNIMDLAERANPFMNQCLYEINVERSTMVLDEFEVFPNHLGKLKTRTKTQYGVKNLKVSGFSFQGSLN